MVGERGFEPPTPWSRKRDSGVVLNVFNLVEWCFDHLSLAQIPHSGVTVGVVERHSHSYRWKRNVVQVPEWQSHTGVSAVSEEPGFRE